MVETWKAFCRGFWQMLYARRPQNPREWHLYEQFVYPRPIKLHDGTISDASELMRRDGGGTWQYRALTAGEKREHEDDTVERYP